MRIVVDCDGVLNDFWNTYSNTFAGVTNGNYWNKNEITRDFWNNPKYDFWVTLPAITDYKQFNSIMEGHEVIFLTNTAHPKARKNWLAQNGFLTEDRTLICNPPNTSKKAILKLLQPDVFIDDYGKNIEEAKELNIPLCWKFDNEVTNHIEWRNIERELRSLNDYLTIR